MKVKKDKLQNRRKYLPILCRKRDLNPEKKKKKRNSFTSIRKQINFKIHTENSTVISPNIWMPNKPMKRCPISLGIVEICIKTISYDFTPTRMAVIRNRQKPVLMWMWVNWQFGCSMIQPLWKIAWKFNWFNIDLPHDPVIPLLGSYAKEMKHRSF